jgi:hypothetical protein
MAGYRIVTQYPDVEVLGGSSVREVQVIGVLTDEHGVYFERRWPRKTATSTTLRTLANVGTIEVESIFAYTGVNGVAWTQEPTPGGLLEDHYLIYVGSSSGESEGVIDVSWRNLTTDYISAHVAALRRALDATEAT